MDATLAARDQLRKDAAVPTSPRRSIPELRVRIMTALQQAFTERHTVVDVVGGAADRRAAIAALRDRFGWDDVQATAVLEMKVQDWTAHGRAHTAAHLAEAQQALPATT